MPNIVKPIAWQYRAYDSAFSIREGVVSGTDDFATAILKLRQQGLQVISIHGIDENQHIALQKLARMKKCVEEQSESELLRSLNYPTKNRIRRMLSWLKSLLGKR